MFSLTEKKTVLCAKPVPNVSKIPKTRHVYYCLCETVNIINVILNITYEMHIVQYASM